MLIESLPTSLLVTQLGNIDRLVEALERRSPATILLIHNARSSFRVLATVEHLRVWPLRLTLSQAAVNAAYISVVHQVGGLTGIGRFLGTSRLFLEVEDHGVGLLEGLLQVQFGVVGAGQAVFLRGLEDGRHVSVIFVVVSLGPIGLLVQHSLHCKVVEGAGLGLGLRCPGQRLAAVPLREHPVVFGHHVGPLELGFVIEFVLRVLCLLQVGLAS